MRTELHEPSGSLRRSRPRWDSEKRALTLEPLAVDEAMADETMPNWTEPNTRCDAAVDRASPEHPSGSHWRPSAERSDDQLLESLAEQLDLLHEQQREIRQLLDRAGRTRIDNANA